MTLQIGILTSSQGGSPLQDCIQRCLEKMGHKAEPYAGPNAEYDLVFIFNQTAHRKDYEYPDFPKDSTPIAFVDTAEYGWWTHTDRQLAMYANAFTPDALQASTKNQFQQERLKRFLEGKSFPYFLHEMGLKNEYPSSYHPIDYPLYHHSVCKKEPNRDEYLRREQEIYVSWGASHPWRVNLSEDIRKGMRENGIKGELRILEEMQPDGTRTRRLPQMECFAKTEQALCSVSYDGFGVSAFRMVEVACRTALLMAPLPIRMREPLLNGVSCIHYNVRGDIIESDTPGAAGSHTYLGSNIARTIQRVTINKEWAFGIYQRGYWHTMEKLSEEATVRYMLETAYAHNYNEPTPVDLGIPVPALEGV